MPKEIRLKKLEKNSDKELFSNDIKKYLSTTDKPECHSIAKGALEFGNIVGSVLGLAIFAPQVSHLIVHPVLNAAGVRQPDEKEINDD